MKKTILEFQKRCYSEYILDLQKEGLIPEKYLFPFGNPIRTIVPTKTKTNGIMVIGAFPSARFENVDNVLIPAANNLSPFGEEEYFDGKNIRVQESRKSLDKNYFSKLNINPNNIWLTDIVKVYLFPEKHIKNCKKVNDNIQYVNTHQKFKAIAKKSKIWIEEEISICNPKLIITLGEITARILSGDNKSQNVHLLNGYVNQIQVDGKIYNTAYLPHPEIFRINKDWKLRTEKALNSIKKFIIKSGINT